MKTIFLIILAGIYANVYAQPDAKPQLSATKFTPISEKIKKLSNASSLAKMNPGLANILSSAKMTASNNCYLSFEKPILVTPHEVEFDVYELSHLGGSRLRTSFPANMGGVYVFELNIALSYLATDFIFNINCAGATQKINLKNNIGQGKEYYDNKLVFAITVPNSGARVEIVTKSGSWKFRNVEITPMK